MKKQNLIPHQVQPVNRITTGQLPSELAELTEEVLSTTGGGVSASINILQTGMGGAICVPHICSFDGDDAES